ncbi:lipase family alpha/beta hydrolase [Micromonospora coxensis]|uniref:Triacylglycerol esterase/lipase EstA, alpha/beta hydrolase fold n=1 Tax=Micromonospora coxensis TaxID=356852 RepID=A0A1C5HK22_9ACTN|nr:alpha/beta fold hydrolase [Micromonospora coxensis]SCG46318.1 Triacylglycerol esterase/lipase EstA, alpha/beta hydrolase fold [Micromonospora coxensis]
MLLRTILAATAALAVLLVPATAVQAAPDRSTAAPAATTGQSDTADRTAAAQAGAADRAAAAPGTVAAPAPAPDGSAPASVAGEAFTVAANANPVIVVGGLIGVSIAYEPIAARLRADGFRVSIYQLPGLGFGDIRESAKAFRSYVDQVRASTGAAKVDIVAHSEGGLVSRWYVKFLGGADAVGRYVSLGSPQQGTYVANILNVVGLGSCAGIVACQQMSIGSDFLANLNGGDDTPGALRWTTVRTWQDELVRPVGNASLADGATNVLIQGWCPLRVVGHLGLVLDGTTYTVVRQVLTDRPIWPNCFAL